MENKAPFIIGCMRMCNIDKKTAEEVINTSLEHGLNYFDHADIYGGGESERIFAKAACLTPKKREQMIIQSKCGIVPGVMYDLSKDYILKSVDGILSRLETEYLDVLLLHRPDPLVQPEEVAEAFSILHGSGKVRNFGVSNHSPEQIALLQKYVPFKIGIDQLQYSIKHAGLVSQGMHVNMVGEEVNYYGGGIIEYCRMNDIQLQAWSPLQYGMFAGSFINNSLFPELNNKLCEIAESRNVSPSAIALAWILRHPAGITPISGSMNPKHIVQSLDAVNVNLSKEEWYSILLSAGYTLP